MTPDDIAKELGVDPKRVRDYLRENFTRSKAEKHQPWVVTPDMATALRANFSGR